MFIKLNVIEVIIVEYEVVLRNGNYALILRGKSRKEYAVVYGLDDESKSWAWTVGYFNFSEMSQIDKQEALTRALKLFNQKTGLDDSVYGD